MTHVSDAVKVEEMPEPEQPKAVARRTGTAVARTAENIDQLFTLAVERGMPAAELKELVTLHREVRQDLARQAFFEALAAFQQEVGPIVKKRQADFATRDGEGMKYKFANVDDIMTAVRPTMIKHGLSVAWDQELNGGNCTIICTVMHIDGHSQPTRFTVPTETRAGMSQQQKVGAAGSYAQARVLGLALGITTTEGEPTQGIDPTPVTDEQLLTIQEAFENSGAPVARFLKWLGVEKASDIRQVDYLRVMQAIEDYAANKAAKARKGGAQ